MNKMTEDQILEMAARIEQLEAAANPDKATVQLQIDSAKALYMADLDLSSLKRGAQYRETAFPQIASKLHNTKYKIIHSDVEVHFDMLQQAIADGCKVATIDDAQATAIVQGRIYSLLIKSSRERDTDKQNMKRAAEKKVQIAKEAAIEELSIIMAEKAAAEASDKAYQEAVKAAKAKYDNL